MILGLSLRERGVGGKGDGGVDDGLAGRKQGGTVWQVMIDVAQFSQIRSSGQRWVMIMSDRSVALDATILRDLFERIFVINLAERQDRRNEIADQLALVGLTFEDPLVELFPAVRPADRGDFPSIGARGCFMSHLGIIERAVGLGLTRILILEDDMDWTRVITNISGEDLRLLTETDWHFLHGGQVTGPPKEASPFGMKRLDPKESLLCSHFIGLRGEIIQKAFPYLKDMLAREPGSPDGGPMHVDGAYSWLRKDFPGFVGYVCEPALAMQRPSRSDIAEVKGWRALPGMQSVLEAVRGLRKRLRGRAGKGR